MGILDDPLHPSTIEILRRSIVVLEPGRAAQVERDRALTLLEELQRRGDEREMVSDRLRRLLDRLEPGPGRPG